MQKLLFSALALLSIGFGYCSTSDAPSSPTNIYWVVNLINPPIFMSNKPSLTVAYVQLPYNHTTNSNGEHVVPLAFYPAGNPVGQTDNFSLQIKMPWAFVMDPLSNLVVENHERKRTVRGHLKSTEGPVATLIHERENDILDSSRIWELVPSKKIKIYRGTFMKIVISVREITI